MLSTFQDKIFKKIDALGTNKSCNGDGTYKSLVPFGGGRTMEEDGSSGKVHTDEFLKIGCFPTR